MRPSITVLLLVACGTGTAQVVAPTTVATRDPSGDLVLRGTQSDEDIHGPRWLAGLRQDDVLSYRVEKQEARLTRRYRVARMVRRGHGVAALMMPMKGDFTDDQPSPYWLAGDEEALFRLERGPDLLDPEFAPLDAVGRVVQQVRSEALWRIPQTWPASDAAPAEEGWSVEELSMTLDGPVRGDRCARVGRRDQRPPLSIVVCGNVGVVELRRGDDELLIEHWELIEITR